MHTVRSSLVIVFLSSLIAACGGGGGSSPTPSPQPDTVPDAFSFTDVTDAALSAQASSNSITVNGIDSATAISISGGEYALDGDTTFTAASGSVINGQTVVVRGVAAAEFSTATTVTLTIGGVEASFSITTVAADTAPDAFAFAPIADALVNSVVQSSAITVSGINSSATISVTGAQYAISGGDFTEADGTVNEGDTVVVQLSAAAAFSTPVEATLSIGGVTGVFLVTTQERDTTPEPFVFAPVSGAEPSSVVGSNTITVQGINDAAAISVVGGSYSIDGGSPEDVDGSVLAGQTVQVQLAAASALDTASEMTLTIGGVGATFSVTTRGDISAPTASVIFPPLNSKTDGDTVFVRGVASDTESEIASVTVNGVEVTSADNYATWEVTVPLAEGSNTLTVAATDGANNTEAAAASVTVVRGTHDAPFPNASHPLGLPTGFYLDSPRNRILVGGGTGGSASAIVAVDMATGSRSVVSDASTPSEGQAPLRQPRHFLLNAEGDALYVMDAGVNAIYLLDLATGERTAFVDAATEGLSESVFDNPSTMIVNPDDADEILFITQIDDEKLMAVNVVDRVGLEVFVYDDLSPHINIVGLAYSEIVGRALILNRAASIIPGIYDLDLDDGNIGLFNNPRDYSDWDFTDWYVFTMLVNEPLAYVINGAPGSAPSEGIRIETMPVIDEGGPAALSSNTLPNSANGYEDLTALKALPGLGFIIVIGTSGDQILMFAVDKQTGQRVVISSWARISV